jgi:hypothetical protein
VSADSGSDADRPRRVAVPVVNVLAVVDVAPPRPLSVSGPAAPPVAGSVVPAQLVTYPNEQSATELPVSSSFLYL